MTARLLLYLVEASVCLTFLYGVYRLCLQNETFHGLNRAYLVLTMLLSLLIPVLDIPVTTGSTMMSPLERVDRLEHRVSRYLGAPAARDVVAHTPDEIAASAGSPDASRSLMVRIGVIEVILAAYGCGLLLLCVRLLVGLVQAIRLVRGGHLRWVEGVLLVDTRHEVGPCCFINKIVVNCAAVTEDELATLVRHERVHIRQGHAVDSALAQGLAVLLWFNPIAWFYRNAVRQNHEYLADAGVCAGSRSDRSYLALMLRHAARPVGSALAHCFNLGLIERRIAMLRRPRSDRRARLKLLGVFPIVALLLALFAARFEAARATEVGLHIMGGERAMPVRTDPYAPVLLGDIEAIFDEVLAEVHREDYVLRSYIYCRLACMRVAGWEDAEYEMLMPVSGYGLTFAYAAKAQSGAHFVAPPGTDERIARATGFGWEWLRFRDAESCWQALKETIDSGRPAQGPHLEELIFVGYQEAERKKDRKVRPVAIPVFIKPGQWWSWREFQAWFREFGTLGRFAGRVEKLDERQVAIEVMKDLVTLAHRDPRENDPECDRVRWGLAGIGAFADDMADVAMNERHFCSGWFGCHDSNPQWTARQLTGRYLEESSTQFGGEVGALMRAAAEDYAAAHRAWLAWDEQLGGRSPNRAWRDRQRRLKGAEAVRRAAQYERSAVEKVERALALL